MWAEGSIKVGDSIFHYCVKHYEEPIEDYGIDGGRISKLMLNRNGDWTLSRLTRTRRQPLPFL